MNLLQTLAPKVFCLVGLYAILLCSSGPPAGAQRNGGTESKPLNFQDSPVLKSFTPTAVEPYNRKAESFWYRGSTGFKTYRFLCGFSEVNYTVLRFSSRQAMQDWDARFSRLGIRSDWRAGDVFKNAGALKPKVVSELPPPTGLIAVHVDFSVGNQVILVGGNQHKAQFRGGLFSRSKGLSDRGLTRTVLAVAQELKRGISSSPTVKSPK